MEAVNDASVMSYHGCKNAAIRFMLSGLDAFMIAGPPGTGKTAMRFDIAKGLGGQLVFMTQPALDDVIAACSGAIGDAVGTLPQPSASASKDTVRANMGLVVLRALSGGSSRENQRGSRLFIRPRGCGWADTRRVPIRPPK